MANTFSTESSVMAALAEKYSGEEWAFLPHVRNCTGFAHKVRTIDAMAMNLWPSRGLELHGFEIKTRRSDWLSELRQPEKAEAICKFCNRFWLVVGDTKIIKDGELPPTWGLIVPRGKKVIVKKPAPLLGHPELPNSFVAALLRAATKVTGNLVPQSDISGKIDAAYQHGRKVGDQDHERLNKQLVEMAKSIAEFQKISGIQINRWDYGNVAEAVKLLTRGQSSNLLTKLRNLHKGLSQVVEFMENDRATKK